MFSTSMNQFLASNTHLCRWHWYSAKKWSKMLISAWSRSPKILHPPFCSYHRLLCNDKALEKNTAGKSAIRAWDIKIKSTIKVNVRDFERWSEIAGWLRKTVQLVCVSVRPAPIPVPACAQQRPSLSFAAAHLVKQPGRWVYLCRPKQIKNWQNKETYVWPIGFAKTNIWPQSTHHNNNRSDADEDNITIKPLCLCCWLINIVLLSYKTTHFPPLFRYEIPIEYKYKTTYFPPLLGYNIPIELYTLGKLSSLVFGSH